MIGMPADKRIDWHRWIEGGTKELMEFEVKPRGIDKKLRDHQIPHGYVVVDKKGKVFELNHLLSQMLKDLRVSIAADGYWTLSEFFKALLAVSWAVAPMPGSKPARVDGGMDFINGVFFEDLRPNILKLPVKEHGILDRLLVRFLQGRVLKILLKPIARRVLEVVVKLTDSLFSRYI